MAPPNETSSASDTERPFPTPPVLLDDPKVAPNEAVVYRALHEAAGAGADDGRLGWIDLESTAST
jgi:hypothetical protein